MKIIMTFIVTMAIATLGLHAYTPQVDSEFTVTQIALDTAAENEAAINQALEAMVKDKNTSNAGGDTEKK